MAEITEDHVKAFVTQAQAFKSGHPDLVDALQKAADRGLTIENDAVREFIRYGRLGVEALYDLVKPENEGLARSIMGLKGLRGEDKARRIIDAVRRNQTYMTPQAELSATDQYLEQRHKDFASGKRRRR